ncbi:MAG: hypothetical protein ATN31_00540 [Candidatus Epulonipiscioides saccharophilum]|nr:MAG: hypothetical protein ATN31_00540 [Epulopiscium sp. AS2M-Bin001]
MSNIIKGSYPVNTQKVVEIGKHFLEDSAPVLSMESITKLEEETRLTLENATAQADQMISEAKLEVEKMYELADKQIEEEKKEFEKQLNYKKDESDKEYANIINQANQSAQKIHEQALFEKNQTLQNIESEVVDLVIALVGSIVSNEVSNSNKWIPYIVSKLLFGEDIAPDIEIGLSESVYDSLTKEELSDLSNVRKNAKVDVNDRLSGHTIEISTDRGQIIYDPFKSLREVTKDLKLLSEVEDGFAQ